MFPKVVKVPGPEWAQMKQDIADLTSVVGELKDVIQKSLVAKAKQNNSALNSFNENMMTSGDICNTFPLLKDRAKGYDHNEDLKQYKVSGRLSVYLREQHDITSVGEKPVKGKSYTVKLFDRKEIEALDKRLNEELALERKSSKQPDLDAVPF